MNKKKVLNLYAGIGGNRKLWTNVNVTAVELNYDIARIYKDFFPEDDVIVTDAHKYLEKNFKEFDFIWSSPPCPSHSKIRKNSAVARGQNDPIYPNMMLYEEVLFLQGYFQGKYCVENVISWYEPLIEPQIIGSHYYWSNFSIPNFKSGNREHDSGLETLQKRKGFDLSKCFGIDKRKALRNCVEPEFGLHIFNCVFANEKEKYESVSKQENQYKLEF